MRPAAPHAPRLQAFRRALARLVVALVALAFACSLSSCRRARAYAWRHSAAGRAKAAATRARVAQGRARYARYCALCHGPDGRGYAADHANAIGNRDFLAIASDGFLRKAIVDGRPGTPMSAWGRAHGGPLHDESVDEIVAYLRSLARGPFVRVDAVRVAGRAKEGEGEWVARCASCHGARGEGSPAATSVSHPNFLRAASDGFLRRTIERGRAGTPMAAFGALPRQTIDDLVAYVRTLEHMPGPPPPPVYEPPPGLDRLVINPQGRAPAFTLREDRFVAAEQVARALAEGRRMIVLDARAASDWSLGHIPGALPFPFYDIEQMAAQIPRDGTWVIAYCACPHAASGHVVDELRRRRFPHAAVLDEGVGFWASRGYPMAHAAVVSPR